METKDLINLLRKHPHLHDLITHLPDFQHAVDSLVDGTSLEFDRSDGYWKRQQNIISNLQRLINENSDPNDARSHCTNLYLDCEFNGFRGELMSLALFNEDGDYWHGALAPPLENLDPWVETNVVPIYRKNSFVYRTREEFNKNLRKYLFRFVRPNIRTDWYADLEYFFSCFNGTDYQSSMAFECTTEIKLIDSLDSKLPHNALADAEALKLAWKKYDV